MSRLAWKRRSVPAASGGGDAQGGTSRRSFLRSCGGYATGVAALAIPAAAVVVAEADASVPAAKTIGNPTTPVPSEPVMAYVHDAKRGTVVIMNGTTERTVRDRELVRRLLVAPKKTRSHKAARKRRPAAKTVPKARP